jgi:hypothetical protein
MSDMTDLEITRLCAEAMDLPEDYSVTKTIGYREEGHIWTRHEADAIGSMYHPLHDDAQAMALVKRMELYIAPDPNGWDVGPENTKGDAVINTDLNRAICECVARMQLAKREGK